MCWSANTISMYKFEHVEMHPYYVKELDILNSISLFCVESANNTEELFKNPLNDNEIEKFRTEIRVLLLE